MSDDLVKRICHAWINDGRADDCFWEGWPECPAPEDSLTPRMVIDRIEALEAENAELRRALRLMVYLQSGGPIMGNDASRWLDEARTALDTKGYTDE